MTETVNIDRPPLAKPVAAVSRPRSTKPATVSASALARHLDCSRQYLTKLEADGVIRREGDGFNLDAARTSYIRHLRRERQQSPRSEADTDFQRAKAELIRLRIDEKQRKLIPIDEAIEVTEKICGVMLTHLSGLPARIADRDLQARRRAEAVVREIRTEIASTARKLADERGEPSEERKDE